MKPVRLYPYPRIQDWTDWSELNVALNGQVVATTDLADRWDADSEIQISIEVTVPRDKLTDYSQTDLRLVLSVSCSDTCESFRTSSRFDGGSKSVRASATVALTGDRIAQRLAVRAAITAPHEGGEWLKRRIIAEGPAERINLDSSFDGFPTSAVSFSSNNLREAPWMLTINASDLSDPFSSSIRLNLNTDYPRIIELIEGRAQPHVEQALQAEIIRTLIHTARALTDESEDGTEVVVAINDHPESIAAAAEKASRDYLKHPLQSTIDFARSSPEHLEYLINDAVGSLREKR